MSLVIAKYVPQILKLIQENPVTKISAETGSGKSLGVPVFASKFIGTSNPKPIFVTGPTRISVRNLYNGLTSILKSDPGWMKPKGMNGPLEIGYATKDEVKFSSRTNIVYMTPGYLLKIFQGKFQGGKAPEVIDFCTLMIIDEYHLRTAENDLIINLWQYCALKGIGVPKLLIMSATPTPIDFDPSITVGEFNVPVPRNFTYAIEYLKFSDISPKSNQIWDLVARKLAMIYPSELTIKEKIEEVKKEESEEESEESEADDGEGDENEEESESEEESEEEEEKKEVTSLSSSASLSATVSSQVGFPKPDATAIVPK